MLARPLQLASGLVIKNRLAKAAASECLATADHAPSDALAALYERFAEGGAGLLITGNVMLDAQYLERWGNVVVEDARHLAALERWAAAGNAHGSALLMQLNHAGRQTTRLINRRPAGPSAGPAVDVLFAYARPRALQSREIREIIARFGSAAQVAERAGFSGVQVDAAHGYLLSQFLSPRTNLRGDAWGGSLENRARLLLEALSAVRTATSRSFTVAVKLNSADFQRGGFEEDEALEVVRWLADAGVDLLEISGGTYETPALLGLSASTRAREVYFLDFARRVRACTRMPLMVTGGFRTREAMECALAEDALDLVGLSRPLLLEPDLPGRLLSGEATRSVAKRLDVPKPFFALAEAAYYDFQIQRLALGRRPKLQLSPFRAIARYVVRDLYAVLVQAIRSRCPIACALLPRSLGLPR